MRTSHCLWSGFLTMVLALGFMACSSGGGGNPEGILDAAGNATSSLNSNEPVTLAVNGLEVNTQYFINVEDPNGGSLSPTGGFIATSDEDGRIPSATLLHSIPEAAVASRLNVTRGLSPMSTRAQTVTTGTYTVIILDGEGNEVKRFTFTLADNPKIYCSDESGVGGASFARNEDVYITFDEGDGSIEDGTYTCYVISDRSAVLEDGDTLVGVRSADITVSSSNKTGLILAKNLFQVENHGYDVVCDMNADGLYTRGTDLISKAPRFNPCFTIQDAQDDENKPHIVGQVCSDRNGHYRDVFDPNATDASMRDMFAWITPEKRHTVTHRTGVRKYVVAHKDTWSGGETLRDVTGASGTQAFELDAVQAFCTNEAPWLIWPRQRMEAGCYDCIIDVNADGLYTKGVDFLDNIDNTSDTTTCGARVSDSACGDFVTITNEDGSSVEETSVTLTGTFEAAPVSASVTITSALQQNTTALNVTEMTFSGNIPLFNGENIITVTAIKSDGGSCSKTIRITSTATTSLNNLFKVQLTWDPDQTPNDYDMDLHLVAPGGSYASSRDCYYLNCKVQTDGGNQIDWGAGGEPDEVEDNDPKLDVDCTDNCSRIENIWMNEISQDGEYKIIVDAYDDTAKNVRVSVFIRGTNVGNVNCGSMSASDLLKDICQVGTITWTGGSSGNGAFQATGILE